MKEVISKKRFMGVAIVIEWKDTDYKTKINMQIPIRRYVRSNRPGIIKYDGFLNIFNRWYNLPDDDIKTLLAINCCRVALQQSINDSNRRLKEANYDALEMPKVILYQHLSEADVTKLEICDEIDLLCMLCGYKWTYDTIKKMDTSTFRHMQNVYSTDKDTLLAKIACRWHNNATNQVKDQLIAQMLTAKIRICIDESDLGYYFQKNALNYGDFFNSARMLKQRYYSTQTKGDCFNNMGIKQRIWLYFHRRFY